MTRHSIHGIIAWAVICLPAWLIICLPASTFAGDHDGHDTSVVTLRSLLTEMINRNSLANYTGPPYRLYHSSSWDRAESGGSGSKGWFGNKDYDYYIRAEKNGGRKEYVIMEARGPGAITKWWIPQAAFLNDRIVRIYLDDDPVPVIEENYKQFIQGSSFIKWPFAFVSSDEKNAIYQYSMPVGLPNQVGSDLYMPIPFAKSCKVTLDDSVFYYALDYRLYAPGTKVVSFSRAGYERDLSFVQAAGRKLLAANSLPVNSPSANSPSANRASASPAKSATIGKDQSIEIDLPAGTHAINGLYLKINSANDKQMNRAVVLQVIADDSQTVWSPVAEFFGGGVYARPVRNYNTEVTADGWMTSHWVMPYRRSARIIVRNYGDEPVKAELKATIESFGWGDHSMYFHAGWHEEAPLNAPPFKDWNYIDIKGDGKYVGDVLTVYSKPKAWWGEGDEKIYIDGESFPSYLGTGMEDYYGFAWGLANEFNSPFISMPARDARGKDNWSGYNTVERMRLLDNIPFDHSLKVDMEAWITQPGVSFSVTCFWYGKEGAVANWQPDTTAITRKLPDFAGMHLQKLPGTPYADPVGNRQLLGKGKGGIRYAGDRLDRLGWADIGTAGHVIFGDRIFSMYSSVADSDNHLPAFITGLASGHVTSQDGTFIPYHGTSNKLHHTGAIEVTGAVAEKGVVSFTIGKDAPSSFRVGIMVDNADVYTKVGKYLWVADAGSGSSGKVQLVRSNRVPDWYFFDIEGHKEGDVITIYGSTEHKDDPFIIGALTFDADQAVISFDGMLQEMLDRDRLAVYPAGAWTLHHASSYDRKSLAPDKPGWFANRDWDNFIRKDSLNGREEDVLLDADGPGAITRFWVAGWPEKKADLRFYIDGQSTPFWEADHPGALIGQNVQIGSPLSERSFDRDSSLINPGARPGHDLYAPIPFSRHIKITYHRAPGDAANGFWYNIDYRLYKPGTAVKSFSAAIPVTAAAVLRLTNDKLNDFMALSAAEATVAGETAIGHLPFDLAGGSVVTMPLKGAGAIRRILLSMPPDDAKAAVTQLWVRIAFDGQKTIDIPAGFFFGCGDQIVETKSWYNKVDTTGAMAIYQVMPYHRGAVISLVNKGSDRIKGVLKVATGHWDWNERTMYLHAGFKRLDHYITVAQKGTDFNYVDIKDKAGVYVGDILQVNKAVGGWWGEGDEKIYIDGSTFPDDFGTGSEDYYGYAWGHPETFNHPFFSQPLGNANLEDKGGTTVNSRERDLDAIPFRHSLRFDMESWNWFGGPVNYALACFWYEKP